MIFYAFNINPYFFFFNDTATTEIYTLSLHDALPICSITSAPTTVSRTGCTAASRRAGRRALRVGATTGDRKSTRLNSSHLVISYAVFCLKKQTLCPKRCTQCPQPTHQREPKI